MHLFALAFAGWGGRAVFGPKTAVLGADQLLQRRVEIKAQLNTRTEPAGSVPLRVGMGGVGVHPPRITRLVALRNGTLEAPHARKRV